MQDKDNPNWRDEATGRVYCIDLEYWVTNLDLFEHSTSDDESTNDDLAREVTRLPPIPLRQKHCKASPSEFGTDFGTYSTCVSLTELKSFPNYADLKSYSHECIIELEDLQLCDRIGQGHTGVVWKGYVKGLDTEDVAIKQISTLCSNDKVARFLGEIRALRSTPHPNIVRMIGVTLSGQPGPVHLVSEYCAGGSCFDLVRSCKPVTDMQAGKILVDVAEAMCHLHSLSPRILHRNLTSRNVLLEEPVSSSATIPHAKVSDFNLACLVSEGAADCTWLAPEVIDNGLYSEKADVYSFAIFMYEVFYRKMPFADVPSSNLSSLISEGLRPQLVEATSETLWVQSVMSAGWGPLPSSRPSFREVAKKLVQVPLFGRLKSI